mgnify:CR=1 FL=1
MRLTEQLLLAIRETAAELLGADTRLRLFGSRDGPVASDQSMWERRPRRDMGDWFQERNLRGLRSAFPGI